MNIGTAIGSSIGRKIINGVTGLFFVGFVIGHLTGNFLLFGGPDLFNSYAYFLTHLFHGMGIYLVEAVMLTFLLFHAVSGISVWRNKWAARQHAYSAKGNAGGKSAKGRASQSMLWTGLLLLVFIAFHVAQFKFGLTDQRAPADFHVVVDGVQMDNLYGRVVDSFQQPIWAFGYIFIMAMLGSHLWHGIWSAFQSLGLANDRYLPVLRKLGHVMATLLAVGFLALPAVIYARNSHYQKLDQEYVTLHAAPTTDSSASHSQIGE